MEAAAVTAAEAALLKVDATALELAAQRTRSAAQLATDMSAAVARTLPGEWSGNGREACVAVIADLHRRLNALASAFGAIAYALTALAVALRSVQGEVTAARRVLRSAGPLDVSSAVAGQLQQSFRSFQEADRRTAGLLCDALLTDLTQRNRTLALASPTLQAKATAYAAEVLVAPALPATPAAVALWWAGLSPGTRTLVAGVWPRGLGGVDGIPARVRDAINRRRLAYAITDAQHEYERAAGTSGREIGRELVLDVSRLLPWPLSRLVAGLADDTRRAAARLRSLRALTRTLTQRGSELLVFTADGDGRAVVASGDVESSRAVAVVVPGMTTDLSDLPRLVAEGDRLALAAGSGAVSIAWLGYDAPGLTQVVSDRKARSGAAALQRFTAGLRSTAEARQRVTVVGHSYGTLVAGIAARRGLGADGLVLLASPGIEAVHVTDLELPAQRVWAVRDPTDPIRLVFLPNDLGRLLGLPIPLVFGPDPAAAAFGARHFDTGGAYGHSGYFTAGSRSLDNLGRIVAGREAR